MKITIIFDEEMDKYYIDLYKSLSREERSEVRELAFGAIIGYFEEEKAKELAQKNQEKQLNSQRNCEHDYAVVNRDYGRDTELGYYYDDEHSYDRLVKVTYECRKCSHRKKEWEGITWSNWGDDF